MPCKSDYLDPSGAEMESIRVCKLIEFLYKKTNQEVPPWISKAAKDYYGNVNRLDEATKMLCECCRSLTKKETDSYIYNGRDKTSRELADWFERHQEWDNRRVKEECAARKKATLMERALKKLTVDEMKALELI